jgi:DNA-binding IscR family transcriptional regulator
LALSVLAAITRRYLAGETPWLSADLATALQISPAELEDVVQTCVNTGILCRTAEPERLVLGRPPEDVAVAEVFAVIERADEIQVDVERSAENPVERVLAQRSQTLCRSFAGVTLRSLAVTSSGTPRAASEPPVSNEQDPEEAKSGIADSTPVALSA